MLQNLAAGTKKKLQIRDAVEFGCWHEKNNQEKTVSCHFPSEEDYQHSAVLYRVKL